MGGQLEEIRNFHFKKLMIKNNHLDRSKGDAHFGWCCSLSLSTHRASTRCNKKPLCRCKRCRKEKKLGQTKKVHLEDLSATYRVLSSDHTDFSTHRLRDICFWGSMWVGIHSRLPIGRFETEVVSALRSVLNFNPEKHGYFGDRTENTMDHRRERQWTTFWK